MASVASAQQGFPSLNSIKCAQPDTSTETTAREGMNTIIEVTKPVERTDSEDHTFVAYVISVTTPSEQWTVERRYTDFRALMNTLEGYPDLPELPPARGIPGRIVDCILFPMAYSHPMPSPVETRCVKLNELLTKLASRHDVTGCQAFQAFIGARADRPSLYGSSSSSAPSASEEGPILATAMSRPDAGTRERAAQQIQSSYRRHSQRKDSSYSDNMLATIHIRECGKVDFNVKGLYVTVTCLKENPENTTHTYTEVCKPPFRFASKEAIVLLDNVSRANDRIVFTLLEHRSFLPDRVIGQYMFHAEYLLSPENWTEHAGHVTHTMDDGTHVVTLTGVRVQLHRARVTVVDKTGRTLGNSFVRRATITAEGDPRGGEYVVFDARVARRLRQKGSSAASSPAKSVASNVELPPQKASALGSAQETSKPSEVADSETPSEKPIDDKDADAVESGKAELVSPDALDGVSVVAEKGMSDQDSIATLESLRTHPHTPEPTHAENVGAAPMKEEANEVDDAANPVDDDHIEGADNASSTIEDLKESEFPKNDVAEAEKDETDVSGDAMNGLANRSVSSSEASEKPTTKTEGNAAIGDDESTPEKKKRGSVMVRFFGRKQAA